MFDLVQVLGDVFIVQDIFVLARRDRRRRSGSWMPRHSWSVRWHRHELVGVRTVRELSDISGGHSSRAPILPLQFVWEQRVRINKKRTETSLLSVVINPISDTIYSKPKRK